MLDLFPSRREKTVSEFLIPLSELETMLHSWSLSIAEARQIQNDLAKKVVLKGNPEPGLIGGVDCSCLRGMDGIWAAIVVFDISERKMVETACSFQKGVFPYIPGFLAFREGPVVIEAFNKLKVKPGILMFD